MNQNSDVSRRAKKFLGRKIALGIGQKKLKKAAKETGLKNETLFRMFNGYGHFRRDHVSMLARIANVSSEVVEDCMRLIHSPQTEGPHRFRRKATVKCSPRKKFR